MTVWTIDGRVEAAESKRRKGKYVFYNSLKIRDAGGVEHTLSRISAAGGVAKLLTPGASGRFYLTKALDQTGVHGVRLDDGTAAYEHYHNMELIVLIGVGAGLAMLLIALLGADDFMITPIVILPFMLLGYWLFRKARLEGRRQYEADPGKA